MAELTGTFKNTLSVANYKHRNNLVEINVLNAGKGAFFVGDDEHRGAVSKKFDATKPASISELVTEDGEVVPMLHNTGLKVETVTVL